MEQLVKNGIRIFLLTVLIYSSCSKEECSGVTVCDDSFDIIFLEVHDAEGNPVVLQEYSTTIVKSGQVLDIDKTYADTLTGIYPIFTDGQMSKTDFEGELFRFTATNNDEIIVDETFLIGKDCCHIDLVSGKRKVEVTGD